MENGDNCHGTVSTRRSAESMLWFRCHKYLNFLHRTPGPSAGFSFTLDAVGLRKPVSTRTGVFFVAGILEGMGKLHRIRKHFLRVAEQNPAPLGWHYLAGTKACVYVGNDRDGRCFVRHSSFDRAYGSFLNQIVKEFEAGVALRDSSPVKDITSGESRG